MRYHTSLPTVSALIRQATAIITTDPEGAKVVMERAAVEAALQPTKGGRSAKANLTYDAASPAARAQFAAMDDDDVAWSGVTHLRTDDDYGPPTSSLHKLGEWCAQVVSEGLRRGLLPEQIGEHLSTLIRDKRATRASVERRYAVAAFNELLLRAHEQSRRTGEPKLILMSLQYESPLQSPSCETEREGQDDDGSPGATEAEPERLVLGHVTNNVDEGEVIAGILATSATGDETAAETLLTETEALDTNQHETNGGTAQPEVDNG